MIETTSPLYKMIYQENRTSTECLELADKIVTIIPLNSELTVTPYIDMDCDSIVINYDTHVGEISFWVIDRKDFYVEWSFSAKDTDIFIDGFCASMEQIIYLCSNSSFGGHK